VTRRTELHRFEWNGILLEVAYDPQWLPPHILGQDLAHLEVRSIHPTDAPLPITESGYRSHFIAASAIADAAMKCERYPDSVIGSGASVGWMLRTSRCARSWPRM